MRAARSTSQAPANNTTVNPIQVSFARNAPIVQTFLPRWHNYKRLLDLCRHSLNELMNGRNRQRAFSRNRSDAFSFSEQPPNDVMMLHQGRLTAQFHTP